MKLEALKAVLEALSGKCKEDMADRFSSPEDKMDSAMAEAKSDGSDPDQLDMEEDEDLPVDALAKEEVEEDDEESDPVKAGIKQFFKSKKPEPSKPGTAIMIALDKKPMMKKGVMRG